MEYFTGKSFAFNILTAELYLSQTFAINCTFKNLFFIEARESLLECLSQMTPEEKKLVHELCNRIADEKDPDVFSQLVQQLDEVFERKQKRIANHESPSASS